MRQNNNVNESDLPVRLAKPARRGLEGAGYTKLEQLSQINEEEILQLHGVGPQALVRLRIALNEKGLSFKQN